MSNKRVVAALLALLAASCGAAPAGSTIVDLGAGIQPNAINGGGTIAGCTATPGRRWSCDAPDPAPLILGPLSGTAPNK